jgi:hypothetical protein
MILPAEFENGSISGSRQPGFRPDMKRVLRFAILLAPVTVAAQQRIVVQGLADAEAWRTSGGSRLLARNQDRPLVTGRLNLWTAVSLVSNLLGLAHGAAEAGGGEADFRLDQLVLRWSPSRALLVQAGRFPSPIGGFAPRRLPDANPLVGTPDLYPVSYPWGVMVTGVLGRIDYRAGIVDRPVSNERYVPRSGSRARVAVGAGITPAIGLRFGASATSGPYLGPALADSIPGPSSWSDFGQRVLAFDAAWSHGYLELRAEAAWSSYDVPGRAEPTTGEAGYFEAKYTWSPRFFTAVRLERNRYAFIRPTAGPAWMGVATTFVDGEIGLGYRIDHRTLVKATVRADSWDVPPVMRSILPNGSAVAIQVSRGFDLTPSVGR